MSVAHAFWSAPTVNADEEQLILPDYCAFGLQSALQCFGTVYLWQYEDVQNVPQGVVKRDASTLLSADERNVLMEEKKIQVLHISDIVRFRAAGNEGGWVIDADCLWIRTVPDDMFVFSTAWSKRTGGMAPSGAKWQSRIAKFAKDDWDGSGVINTPFSVQKGSEFAHALIDAVDQRVHKIQSNRAWQVPPTINQYNVFMHMVRDLVLRHNKGKFVRPPIEYNVSPFWRGMQRFIVTDFFSLPPSQRMKFGVQFPSIDEILQQAYCVPTSFYFSSLSRFHVPGTTTFHEGIQSHQSLLGRVSSIIGQNALTT